MNTTYITRSRTSKRSVADDAQPITASKRTNKRSKKANQTLVVRRKQKSRRPRSPRSTKTPKKTQMITKYRTITQSINTAIKREYCKPFDNVVCQLASIKYLGSKLVAIIINEFLAENRESFELTQEDFYEWKASLPRGHRTTRDWKATKDPELCGLRGIIRRAFAYVCIRHCRTPCIAAERRAYVHWDANWPYVGKEFKPNGHGLKGFITLACKRYYECLERHSIHSLFGYMKQLVKLRFPDLSKKMIENTAHHLWTHLGGVYRNAGARKLVEMDELDPPEQDLEEVDAEVSAFLKEEKKQFGLSLDTIAHRLHYMHRIRVFFESHNCYQLTLPTDQRKLVKVFAMVPDIKMAVSFVDFDMGALSEWIRAKGLTPIPKIEELFDGNYYDKKCRDGWSFAHQHRTDGVQVHVLLKKKLQVTVQQALVQAALDNGRSLDEMRFGANCGGGSIKYPRHGPIDFEQKGAYWEESLVGALEHLGRRRIVGIDPGHINPFTVAVARKNLSAKGLPLVARDFRKLDKSVKTLSLRSYYAQTSMKKSKNHRRSNREHQTPIEQADSECNAVSLKHCDLNLLIQAIAVHLRHFAIRSKHYAKKQHRRDRFARDCRRRSKIDAFIDNLAPPDAIIALGEALRYPKFKGSRCSITMKLARALCSRRPVVLIKEHNTTKMCSKCSWRSGDGVELEKVNCTYELPDPAFPKRMKRRCHKRQLNESGDAFDQERVARKRTWDIHGLRYCPSCGHYWNRDFNAAVNIGIRCSYLLLGRQLPNAFIA